jgi:hypothetical protein
MEGEAMHDASRRYDARAIGAIVLGSLLLPLSGVWADEPADDFEVAVTEEEEADDAESEIEKRLKTLEDRVKAVLGDISLGGYVESSYTWSDADAPDNEIVGRSFDRKDSQFMFNAAQITLSKPVETDKWDAGFTTKFLFGQNAKLIQSSGLSLGDQGDLEEGYVWLNAPIGNGLQFKAGKWVTLMGVEVIEDIVNPTWSEGNQFLFVENFTGTGIEVSYRWTDIIDTQFRVYNGWDVVDDNNNARSFMGRLGIAPSERTVISIVPYGGPEQADNSSNWRKGINVVVSQKLTDQLTLFGQGDYGHEDDAAPLDATEDAEWWAVGGWLLYEVNDKVGFGFRGDYLDDKDGARTSLSPFTAPFPLNSGNRLWSLTLTLNTKFWEHVLVRPEFRYDHSSVSNAFGDSADQVTLGMSVAYVLP